MGQRWKLPNKPKKNSPIGPRHWGIKTSVRIHKSNINRTPHKWQNYGPTNHCFSGPQAQQVKGSAGPKMRTSPIRYWTHKSWLPRPTSPNKISKSCWTHRSVSKQKHHTDPHVWSNGRASTENKSWQLDPQVLTIGPTSPVNWTHKSGQLDPQVQQQIYVNLTSLSRTHKSYKVKTSQTHKSLDPQVP